MPELEREGTFLCRAARWSVSYAASGAVGVEVILEILKQDDGNGGWGAEWPQRPDTEPYTTRCYTSIIKKDSTVNSRGVETLRDCFGWNGEIQFIAANELQPTEVEAVVKPGTFRGETVFEAAWINPVGGGGSKSGTLDAAGAAEIDAKYGSQLRAILGSGSTTAPQGKPEAPAGPPAVPENPEKLPF